MPSNLQLSDDGEYYLGQDGQRFVRVSRVLEQSGSSRNYAGIDPFYGDRGRAVHFGIELFLRGRLDWSSLDEHTEPFVRAFKEFMRVRDFKPESWEETLGSDHGFAGTIDLVGNLDGQRVLIDHKTAKSVDRAVQLQTGAYEILWEENHPGQFIEERFYLQLGDDGKFNLKSLQEVPAWAFLAKYYAWRWDRKLLIPECPPPWPFKPDLIPAA